MSIGDDFVRDAGDVIRRKTNIWGLESLPKYETGSARGSHRARSIGRGIAGAKHAGESTLNAGKPMGRFLRDHPVAVIAPMAAIGLASTHPIRQVTSQIGTSFEGDPNYLRKLTTAGALGATGLSGYAPGAMGSQPGFGANIMSTGNGPGITSEGNYGYSANPDPDNALRMSEQLPGTNPSGSLVFGLYGNRLK